MAYLPCPTAITLKHNPKIIYTPPLKPTSLHNLCFFTNRLKNRRVRCHASFFGNIPDNLEDTVLKLDQFPLIRSGYLQFQSFTEDLSESQKWGFLVFAGITWIYLTARPGVLIGAIDAYLLAPLQLGLNNLTGKRSLKRSDFVVGNKVGEGSFGVVYSGVIVPKNGTVEDRVQKGRTGKSIETDGRFKEKVILKKVIIN